MDLATLQRLCGDSVEITPTLTIRLCAVHDVEPVPVSVPNALTVSMIAVVAQLLHTWWNVHHHTSTPPSRLLDLGIVDLSASTSAQSATKQIPYSMNDTLGDWLARAHMLMQDGPITVLATVGFKPVILHPPSLSRMDVPVNIVRGDAILFRDTLHLEVWDTVHELKRMLRLLIQQTMGVDMPDGWVHITAFEKRAKRVLSDEWDTVQAYGVRSGTLLTIHSAATSSSRTL